MAVQYELSQSRETAVSWRRKATLTTHLHVQQLPESVDISHLQRCSLAVLPQDLAHVE